MICISVFDGNLSENASEKASIMGTDLGLDSGKDFDVCWKFESGEFEGYTGCSLKFAVWYATIMGQGDTIINKCLHKDVDSNIY